jgi:DNA-directed RNA polymerase subunit F
MLSEDEKERLLTHSEVEKILQESMEKPDKIYHGPEEDVSDRRSFLIEELGEEEAEEEETDPLARLSFEKRATMDHVMGFQRVEEEKAKKMIEELHNIERVTDVHAYKIAELLPRDETELRPVFAKDRFTLEPEELKTIIEIVAKYRL